MSTYEHLPAEALSGEGVTCPACQDLMRVVRGHLERMGEPIRFATGPPHAEVERLRAELADMVPRNWRGLVAILDVMYPDSTVTEDNEEGLRLFPLLRHLDQARAELARRDQQITAVRALAERVQGSVDIAQQEGLYLPEAVNLIELRRALDGTP